MKRAARAVPEPSPFRRAWSAGKLADLALAAVAHLAVLASWGLTATPVMGSLAIARRMAINSEWVFDTGRLPQPWVIVVGIVGIIVSDRFFRWTMGRYARGTPAYGPSVVAWCGVLLGVGYGAYYWQPPVMVGTKVGPSSGQSTPWGILGYAAYYARLWLPSLVGLVTAALVLASRQSPVRVLASARRRARRSAQPPRRARAAAA